MQIAATGWKNARQVGGLATESWLPNVWRRIRLTILQRPMQRSMLDQVSILFCSVSNFRALNTVAAPAWAFGLWPLLQKAPTTPVPSVDLPGRNIWSREIWASQGIGRVIF